ncbi:hypothetical protein AB1286_16745 [Trinickia sp. NRRL B-1857]|uniref:hypothetical protein n=1 Tax=Trinickia sp. NRRL B-1857 TaxID=3162879 RepID=UPI003D2901D0
MATVIYFMPGLFGSIQFPYGGEAGFYVSPVVPGTYAVMFMVLATLLAVTYGYDRLSGNLRGEIAVPDRWVPEVLGAIMVLGAAMSIATIGKGYLCVEKADMLARINSWYYVASYSAPLAFVSALAARKWWLVAAAVAVLLCDLFIGFRGATAVALIGACLTYGHALFGPWKSRIAYVAAVVVVAAGLFVVKQLAWNIKYTVSVDCPPLPVASSTAFSGRFSAEQAREAEQALAAAPTELHLENMAHTANLLRNENVYLDALRYSEPMVIGAILNETVRRGFTIPLSDVAKQALSGIPGGKSVFGIDVSDVPLFSTRFRPVLFPHVTFGMASNPWAQAFAAGGFPLVFVFALVYASCLAGFAAMGRATPVVTRALVAVAVGWWGFYVHRNDVLIQVGIMKMTIYIAVLAMLVGAAIGGAAKFKQIVLGHH